MALRISNAIIIIGFQRNGAGGLEGFDGGFEDCFQTISLVGNGAVAVDLVFLWVGRKNLRVGWHQNIQRALDILPRPPGVHVSVEIGVVNLQGIAKRS